MITFNDFKQAVNLQRDLERTVDSLHQDFKIDIYDTPLFDNFGQLFDIFIDSHFTEAGSDLVYWWIFEDVDKVIEDGEESVDVESITDLWDYMNKYPVDYFKNATKSVS